MAAAYGAARLAVRLAAGGARHRPRRQSAAERLSALPRRGLPVGAPVEISWNDRLVPFIAAASDRDLATALGLVHAHLRLAQMEMLRRVARGRLAEVLGPLAVPFDHSLRVLDPARAVPAILAGLPEATRDWLDGFVAGINHHLGSGTPPPSELRMLGIRAERWSPADVLAIGRLAAADVNWLLWLRLLPLAHGPDWSRTWSRLTAGAAPLPSLGAGRGELDAAFARLVLGLGRAGSNALAVAGRHSATGRGWLAGDPHLSLGLPSVWLQGAWHSPSYQVAGLMIPGIPVMAIGRNPHLAWGGTNLHAASSELFDAAALPPGDIAERRERVAVRWSRPREIVLRDTAWGPVISDAPLFAAADGRRLALRWIGHRPSDETTALLAMARARDTAEFRRAAEGFAVPGQNLVCADSAGHVARLTAAWLPRRAGLPADLVSPPAAAASAAWEHIATAADLPATIDPEAGFVVSANDRPPPGDVPVGWFFSPGDRAERLAAGLSAAQPVDFPAIARLLTDVASATACEWRDRLCAMLSPPPADSPVWQALIAWDGHYEAASPGALAFELVTARLVEALVPPRRRALLAAAWHSRGLLLAEIAARPAAERGAALGAAVAESGGRFLRLRDWGGAHRLRLAHPFGALPAVGRRWRFIDWPWPGSGETVFKSAHGPVRGRHAVSYGSNARYVFDLSDPDGNRLVMLGGQDGVPGSAAFLDQAELFRRGEYVSVPLRPETAAARFRHKTRLEP